MFVLCVFWGTVNLLILIKTDVWSSLTIVFGGFTDASGCGAPTLVMCKSGAFVCS